jgi:hypothetical protein
MSFGVPFFYDNVTEFQVNQTREQKYGMEHIAIDTDELDISITIFRNSVGG